MKNIITKWVLGHKVTLLDVSGDYDYALGETPAKVPGPPPHSHKNFCESFLITEGEMEFFVSGEIINAKAGDLVDLPPDTLHTFSNKSDAVCKWINIHSPKGFRRFFETVGISADMENSQQRSTNQDIIKTVIDTASEYDMHIQV